MSQHLKIGNKVMTTTSVKVFQLNNGTETRHLRFASLSICKEFGFEVKKENYNEVYSAELENAYESTEDFLESLYARFQSSRDENYKGRSLSISDIVEIDGIAYYVDDFGFEQIEF